MYVYLVQFETGPAHALSLLSPQQVQTQGLHPDSIVGVLEEAPNSQAEIKPSEFEANNSFVLLLQQVIADTVPAMKAFQKRATQQKEGFLYVVDLRTAEPKRYVPPEDMLGALEIQKGKIVSYEPNPNHRLLTDRGFFQLFPEIQEALLAKLQQLPPTQTQ